MISKDKTYRTRDGRKVRIYATDGEPNYPVHGAVMDGDGWMVYSWQADGRNNSQALKSDLIEVKPRIKREFWYNVYESSQDINLALSKQEADRNAGPKRLACVKVVIDCEEGEGL